jgi:hypothetical protein
LRDADGASPSAWYQREMQPELTRLTRRASCAFRSPFPTEVLRDRDAREDDTVIRGQDGRDARAGRDGSDESRKREVRALKFVWCMPVAQSPKGLRHLDSRRLCDYNHTNTLTWNQVGADCVDKSVVAATTKETFTPARAPAARASDYRRRSSPYICRHPATSSHRHTVPTPLES